MQIDRIVHDLLIALRFYSRLPVPVKAGESEPYAAPDLNAVAYAMPLAGAVIGLIGGLVLIALAALKLPVFPAAAVAVAAMVLATGAFHEDGLADTADGLGGGATIERRLEIMRDSRIGTYGACALVLSLLMRVGALEALLVHFGPVRMLAALVAASAASRAAGIVLLRALPSVRTDGAAAAVGRPSSDATLACVLVAALLVAVLLIPTFGVGTAFTALIAAALGFGAMARFAGRLIGGQTGDVAGATQQVAEIAILLGVLLYARPV